MKPKEEAKKPPRGGGEGVKGEVQEERVASGKDTV